MDANVEQMEATKKEHGITWTSIREQTGGPIHTKYKVNGYPAIFVIDAKGGLRASYPGFAPQLGQKVDATIAKAIEDASLEGVGR